MLIDFSKPILDLKGKEIPRNPKTPADGVLVLREVAQNALTASFADETTLSGIEKVKRGALALKLESETPLDLTTEEAAQIKTLVDKAYGTMIYFRVNEIFEAAHSAAK